MSFKEIRLLESQDKAYFLDGVRELYCTIEQDPSILAKRTVVTFRRLKSFSIRMLTRFPFLFRFKLKIWDSRSVNFAAMIGGDFGLMLPYAFFSGQNYIYMHDIWPRFHYWIFPLLDLFRIKHVFFSSKQAWQDHVVKFPNSRCGSTWVPEGIDANDYSFKPFDQKYIDVLEFGRRYEKYHLLIRDRLVSNSRIHLYNKQDGALLFKDKLSLIDALAHTKVVICVPSNITHPDRAEYISSMTLRYLQAMATKCLIVGLMPLDMRELFDYLPIVEIDIDRAPEQLMHVLNNYSSYLPLIEKNYLEVRENHQWTNRWENMKQKINDVP